MASRAPRRSTVDRVRAIREMYRIANHGGAGGRRGGGGDSIQSAVSSVHGISRNTAKLAYQEALVQHKKHEEDNQDPLDAALSDIGDALDAAGRGVRGSSLWLQGQWENSLQDVGLANEHGQGDADLREADKQFSGEHHAADLPFVKAVAGNNKIAKALLGFVGDAATDPISYVIPAGTAEEAIGKAAGEEAVKNLGERAVTEAGVRDAAESAAKTFGPGAYDQIIKEAGTPLRDEILTKLARAKTPAALTTNELKDIGARGGFSLAGHGEGFAQGLRHAIWEVNPLAKLRGVGGDVLDHLSQTADEELTTIGKMRGGTAAAKIAARSGDAEKAVPNILGLRAGKAGEALGRGLGEKASQEADKAFAESGIDAHQMPDAMNALEGDRRAAAQFDPEQLAPLRDWYDKWGDQVKQATGGTLNMRENYVNRAITDEMKALQTAGKRGSLGQALDSMLKTRRIEPGADFLGETVPDLSNSGIRHWANEVAQNKLGTDLYRTDLDGLMRLYGRQAGHVIGRAQTLNRLKELGIATERYGFQHEPYKVAKASAEEFATASGRRAVADDARTVLKDALDSKVTTSPERVAALGFASGDIEKAGELATAIHPQATAEAARFHSMAVSADSPTAADHLTVIADHYDSAAKWADESARFAPTDARNPVASLRAQEEMLQGRLAEAGWEYKTADDVMTALRKVGTTSKIDYLQGETRRVALNAFGTELSADPEYAKVMNSILEATQPKNVSQFLEHYDRLLNWLKGWELATPRFASHLVMGHAWNNALGGVNVSRYLDWIKADRAFTKGEEAFAEFAGREPQIAKWYDDARTLIAGQAHEYSSVEVGTRVPLLGDRSVHVPGTRATLDINPRMLARRAGSNIQRLMRGTMVMDTLEKGGDLESALARVTRFHFDYQDLSGFERDVVKRIIPFYVWTRRNMPLQLEMLLQHPSLIQKWRLFTQNLQRGTTPENVVPSYYGDLGAFRLPLKVHGSQAYGTLESTPLRELMDTASDPLNPSTYLSQVTPILKTPLELWAGKQAFKDIPMTGKPVELPGVYKPFAKILEVAGVTSQDKHGNWMIPDDKAYALDQFLPLFANLRRQFPSEKKYQDRGFTQWLNFVLGTPIRVNTPAEQKAEKFRRALASGKLEQKTFFVRHKRKKKHS